jgi:hypothetical protein
LMDIILKMIQKNRLKRRTNFLKSLLNK